MPQNSQPLTLAEALAQLFSRISPVSGTETVPMSKAVGRILAEDIAAPIDLPPFPASAMDGYALRQQDFDPAAPGRFFIAGQSLAGHPSQHHVQAAECVRIFTGAQLPHGADLVLLQEQAQQVDSQHVTFKPHTPAETYIRPVGHDVHAGQLLAEAGTRLTALRFGALTAAGVHKVSVRRQAVVGVFSTGDELVDAGTSPDDLKPGQIFDSNRATVLQLLANGPFELLDLGLLPDEPGAVRTALRDGASRCDAMITSGGVSVGDADYVTAAITELGELTFWRLNLKPGKPVAYGRIGQCHVFGLPGNPVSTIVTALLLAKPALLALSGQTPTPAISVRARLADPIRHTPGRTEYQRGIAGTTEDGLQVRTTGDQSSNRLSTFSEANCLIEVPAASGDLAAGAQVGVLLLSELLG